MFARKYNISLTCGYITLAVNCASSSGLTTEQPSDVRDEGEFSTMPFLVFGSSHTHGGGLKD